MPEPAERDIAQAAAYRVADDQRAGEDRDGGRHAEDNGDIGPPVIDGAGDSELGQSHG